MTARPDRNIKSPHCVTIFGGGITGMTAAHELIERGFTVQVWEPVCNARHPERGCDVGGLARTQWGAVPWRTGRDRIGSLDQRGTHPIVHLAHKFYFLEPKKRSGGKNRPGKPPKIQLGEIAALGPRGETAPRKVAESFVTELEKQPHITEIYCEVFDRDFGEGRLREQVQAVADQAAQKLGKLAKVKFSAMESGDYFDQIHSYVTLWSGRKVLVRVAILDLMPEGLPDAVHCALRFRVRERWLPGEHGFRFFPGFYRHLFDTMKRTPILDIIEKDPLEKAQERSVTVNPASHRYVETGRTTFDNLIPTYKQGVAFKGHELTILPRSLPQSFEEMLHWARFLYSGAKEQGLGGTTRDAASFGLRMLQFLTSCGPRRDDYAEMSWLEFLAGGQNMEAVYSKSFSKAASEWPEALVALDAANADAYTQGLVSAQLLLDNSRPGGLRDATLNGPTSLAWLNPWRRYLEAQGVEFIHGKLIGFEHVEVPDESAFVWPKVECYEPRYPGALQRKPQLLPGYFVLALPAPDTWKLAREYVRVARASGKRLGDDSDLMKMARYPLLTEEATPGDDFGDLAQDEADIKAALGSQIPTQGELRHMVGIQFYFAEDLKWLDGHVTFTDDSLRISSISQARFWVDKHDWEHGHRGVLSVVVSRFDEASKGWTKEKFVEEVWQRVQASLPEQFLPEPLYWHVDEGLVMPGAAGKFINRTPLQVQTVGRWSQRPGKAVTPGPSSRTRFSNLVSKQAYSAYTVDDGIVLAGPCMQTFTRMTTMESANESARHAVNAILQHYRSNVAEAGAGAEFRGNSTPCEIFPPAEFEVQDFKLPIEVDAGLREGGYEHAIDVLGLGDLVAHGFSARPQDPLDLGALFDPMARLVREFRK